MRKWLQFRLWHLFAAMTFCAIGAYLSNHASFGLGYRTEYELNSFRGKPDFYPRSAWLWMSWDNEEVFSLNYPEIDPAPLQATAKRLGLFQ